MPCQTSVTGFERWGSRVEHYWKTRTGDFETDFESLREFTRRFVFP